MARIKSGLAKKTSYLIGSDGGTLINPLPEYDY
jgi:hypothetical protein